MKEKSNLTLFMEQLIRSLKKKSVSVPPTSTKAH